MDNPCLSKGLIADYSTSTCYNQESTVFDYNSMGWYSINNNSPVTNGAWIWNTINNCQFNFAGTILYHPNLKIIDTTQCRIIQTNYKCRLSSWNKLNNSTCEYREPF